jgi:enediyne biosynthesis protein E7
MSVSPRDRPGPNAPTGPPPWLGDLRDDATVVLRHPKAIQHVLQDNHANYIKGIFYDDLRVLLGEGLLTSEGSEWLRQRRLAQPAFQAAALEIYHPVMVETIASFLDSWKARATPGAEVEVFREMARLTLRIVARTLFVIDLGKREDRTLDAISEVLPFDPMSRGPFWGRVYRYLPLFGKVRARLALTTLERTLSWLLANCSGSSLMSSLIKASTEAGEGVGGPRIRGEAATMLLAGHETTAVALTWALYLLCRHPEIQQKVRAEIAEVLGDRSPTPSDMPRLLYTGMVIEETLRLYPPIGSFGRQAVRDDAIADYPIPAQTKIRIRPIDTHRDPELWPEPERFDPERFATAQSGSRPRCAFIPFGAGPRACIAASFAMMEMKLVLAMMLRAARFTLAPGRRVALMNRVTLRPRYGLWLIPAFPRPAMPDP